MEKKACGSSFAAAIVGSCRGYKESWELRGCDKVRRQKLTIACGGCRRGRRHFGCRSPRNGGMPHGLSRQYLCQCWTSGEHGKRRFESIAQARMSTTMRCAVRVVDGLGRSFCASSRLSRAWPAKQDSLASKTSQKLGPLRKHRTPTPPLPLPLPLCTIVLCTVYTSVVYPT